MEYVLESLNADWEAFLRFAPRLIYAVLLLIIVFGLSKLLSRLVATLLAGKAGFKSRERLVRTVVTWIFGSIGLLLALGVLGLEGVAASMLATGGVVAIIAGFAFREIGENLLAGIFLSFSRPFELDDIIMSGGLTGKVRAIELRFVHLRTDDACDVFVPNAQIYREPLHNYTRDGLRLPSFTIGVAYHDQPDQVTAILQRTAGSVEGVLDDPPPRVTVKTFGSAYIEYEVFFWVDVFTNTAGLVATSTAVKIACWRALREAGLTFSSDTIAGIAIDSTPELRVNVSELAATT